MCVRAYARTSHSLSPCFVPMQVLSQFFFFFLVLFLIDKHWFTTSLTKRGFPHFMPLKDLQDASKGLLMNGALIIEGEVIVMPNVK